MKMHSLTNRGTVIHAILVVIFLSMTARGQVAFTLYTLHNNILKLTAQLNMQNAGDKVQLQIMPGSTWEPLEETDVVNPGRTAPFRVEGWDSSKDMPYRVVYGASEWTGVIRKDPVAKDSIIIAAFTGNSPNDHEGGKVSRQDLVDNVKTHGADLLVFTGDQVYNHNDHFNHWLDFGSQFGEIMRDIPTITIPDDHDVGMNNIWGEEGKKSFSGNGEDGGYFKPVEYVNEVERAQTSHLPDPYDPTPVQNGIGVYYTSMVWGGISLAIIEDRKFKTGPGDKFPSEWNSGRPDHINNPDYDPDVYDDPGLNLKLLGDRQLSFLQEWATDWKGAEMKVVVSQTVFAGTSDSPLLDLDANGWPRTGRNKALHEIRRGFAFMLSGDQHLGTMIHHGIDDWNDAGWSFCVPSIASFYTRTWRPGSPGANRDPAMYPQEYTGEYEDGMKNKITMWAVANPMDYGREPANLHDRAAGYGLVVMDKKNRKITMHCWPRQADPRDTGAEYPGWPKTIDQQENYNREAVEYLPTLVVTGMLDPVVQVIDDSNGEVLYTIRIKGDTFRPKVFTPGGTYTVTVGEPGISSEQTLLAVKSHPASIDTTLNVSIGDLPIDKPGQKGLSAAKKVQISWDKNSKSVHFKVSDNNTYFADVIKPNGKIAASRYIKGPGEYLISIPNLESGTYMVKASSGKNSFSEKITTVK